MQERVIWIVDRMKIYNRGKIPIEKQSIEQSIELKDKQWTKTPNN